jgi:hypothetical protein
MPFLSIFLALSLAQPSADAEYRWTQTPADPVRLYLYRGQKQIGGYDLVEHYYRPFDGTNWGEKCDPPLPPPCFGVASNKIGAAPVYRLNGMPIPAKAAYEAVEKGLDDDGRKWRVSIIGPTSIRQTTKSALEQHPDFEAMRGRFVVHDFAPDHWAMRPGFVTTGQPTVYCQTPEGKVLHRQDDFAGGADALVAALRKVHETYDPTRDPDLRPRTFDWQRFATIAAAGLLGAIVILLLRR